MGSAEVPLDPLRLLDTEGGSLATIRVVSEDRDDGVGLVEDHHPSMQIGHRDEITLDGDRGRHPEAGDHLAEELTLEAVVYQAALGAVVAVADQQARLGIDDGLVRLDKSGLTVTDAGRLFIRNIAMRFDPEIETSSTTRYSRTI